MIVAEALPKDLQCLEVKRLGLGKAAQGII
jgi:hypothetical protein